MLSKYLAKSKINYYLPSNCKNQLKLAKKTGTLPYDNVIESIFPGKNVQLFQQLLF